MAGEKKSSQINVSSELNELYGKQRKRLDALFAKEIESNAPIKDTTDNVAVTMKMLELIHSVQSERNIEDAIDSKDKTIAGILDRIEEEQKEDPEEEKEEG